MAFPGSVHSVDVSEVLRLSFQELDLSDLPATDGYAAPTPRVRRGDLIYRGGMVGRFVGWTPRRDEPLIAWEPRRFTDLCRYFDETALNALSLWRCYQVLRRAPRLPGRPLHGAGGAVLWMLGTTALVCACLYAHAAWLAPVLAAAPPLLVWGLSLPGVWALCLTARWALHRRTPQP